MIQSIALVGGTHGNETSGIQLIKNWRERGLPDRFTSLNVTCLLANPDAINANVRFLEEDLNRQFSFKALMSKGTSKEARLAAELNQQLGPKGNACHDLVVDIHNTTSNMGATLIILELDTFNTQLARYVKQVMPEANVLVEDEVPVADHPYLCTTGSKGVMIEVGAQPQGILREDIFQLTETMAEAILDFCVAWNNDSLDNLPACEAFRLGDNVPFPLDEQGQRSAMIHHQLQDADFLPLLRDQPVFRDFAGNDITWQHDTTYPHFINEAAYHQQHVAFATASRITI